MYREYPANIHLQHLIETYWVSDGMVDAAITQQIMPDGCVDIIFDFGKTQTGLPKLVGTMTTLLEITYQPGQIKMMGIRFAPGGITAFTKIPVYEITNRNIELPLAETILDTAFYESLPEIHQMEKRIDYLNRYFMSKLARIHLPDQQINHAVSIMRSSHGLLSVKQLAEETYLCERHFERKFKAAIGISPKVFSTVMRFQYARHYLKVNNEESMYVAAIACGYHDHSHMNKEFQRLGNVSPSDLFKF